MVRNENLGPEWLNPFLNASYFNPCRIHGDSNKNECNYFCLDCMGNALCSCCLIHHKNHQYVQIRRSSYSNVVRVNEVQKHIDVSSIQHYIINSAKVVFLNSRPQLKPGKVATSTCEICSRNLLHSFRFCSLRCKSLTLWFNTIENDETTHLIFQLEVVKRGDSDVTLNVRVKNNVDSFHNSESDLDWSTQKKLRTECSIDTQSSSEGNKECAGNHSRINEETGTNSSPTTSPINVLRTARRKGIPRRAPF